MATTPQNSLADLMKKLLITLALLPGLSFAGDPATTYTCDDGSKMTVAISADPDGRPLATLNIGGKSQTLALIPSASGTHYRGDGANYYSKGDDAIFVDEKDKMRRCTKGDNPPQVAKSPAPAVSSFVDIGGSVTYLQRIALPPDAVLIIRAQDTSRADAKAITLAEQTIELAGQQVPINFQLTVDRDLIGKKARLTLSARIERRGKLLFINDKAYPVKLIDGKSHSEMILRQVGGARGR
jgi:putative lipoprotein